MTSSRRPMNANSAFSAFNKENNQIMVTKTPNQISAKMREALEAKLENIISIQFKFLSFNALLFGLLMLYQLKCFSEDVIATYFIFVNLNLPHELSSGRTNGVNRIFRVTLAPQHPLGGFPTGYAG